MIDWLRAAMNRPLRDADRPRLFLIAGALVVAAAAVFALLDERTPPRATPTVARPVSDPPADPAAAAGLESAPSSAVLEAPSEESRPTAATQTSRREITAVKRAGRRFLAGYLPYTYARASAHQIKAVTPALRRRLVAEPPHVPPREQRRRPRVVLVQTHGVGPRAAELVALVKDGARRYTITLELQRASTGWQVTAIGR